MMKSYLDEFGFFVGEIDTDYMRSDFPFTLVSAVAPETPPTRFHSWSWANEAWVLSEDNRGRLWYLESDTDVEYIGKTPTDIPPTGYLEFVNGIGKVALPPELLRKATAKNRIRRDQLLMSSDWTDTLSSKARLGETLYQSWQTYRQALRDITLQADQFNIVWPTPPQ